MLLLSSKKWVSDRQTLGLNFKLNYAKNQSNSQNSKVLRKWKFDSLLHCEAIRAEYDLEEILSKIHKSMQKVLSEFRLMRISLFFILVAWPICPDPRQASGYAIV